MYAYRQASGWARMAGRPAGLLSLAFLWLGAASLGLAAGESDYFNVTSGDWNTAGNWDTLHVPNPTGTVYIGYAGSGKTNPATATISSGAFSCTNLTLGSGASGYGTLNMSGGSLLVYYNSGGTSISCGNGGTGIIAQTGGSIVSSNAIHIGENAGATGSWTVTNGTVTNYAATYIGYNGAGSMTLRNGGTLVSLSAGHLGYYAGANGLLTVNNGGTALFNTTLTVGEHQSGVGLATGAVVQAGGSLVVANGAVILGNASPGIGSWMMSGGIVTNASSTTLGNASGTTGIWTMAGGTVNTIGMVTLGAASGSLGSWTISGGTLNSPGTVQFGKNGGFGTMLVQGGGVFVDTNAVNIGGSSSYVGSGTLTVNDGTALMNNLGIGDYPGAMGSLVQNAGSVIVTSNTAYLGSANLPGASTGIWTMAGGVATNIGSVMLGKYAGSVGTWTISNGIVNCLGSSIYVGVGGTGYLTLSNATLLAATSSVSMATQNAAGGSGTVLFHDAVAVCSNISMAGASNAMASMTIEGASVVTNLGYLSLGSGSSLNFPGLATVNMTGGTWWQGGLVNVSDPGHGPGETGLVTIAGGTFLPQANVSVGALSGNVGSLSLSNVAVSLPYTLDIGNAGSGTVSVANGSLTVNGTCSLGALSALSTGQCALLTMANAAVTNWGGVNIGQNGGSSLGRISQSGGRWFAATNVNFGAKGTAQYALSNGVFQQTGGSFVLGSLANPTNGPSFVSLTGTQRMFQVTNLIVNAYGSLTNVVAGYAGGLDITSAGTNALAVTGTITLVFAGSPQTTGNYWGLRWLGTNHMAALQAWTNAAPPRLTWTNQVSALNKNTIGIYTGVELGVGYTYVGMQISNVKNPSGGTAILFL